MFATVLSIEHEWRVNRIIGGTLVMRRAANE
jgi:hypothetical protein